MRILAIDPFHGAAGDMLLGALLDLGVEQDPVIRAMASVVATPSVTSVTRAGIRAVKIHTHAGPAHRSLDEVIARVREADAPASVIVRAEGIFRLIAGGERSVHGELSHFHEVGADDAIADVIGSCMAFTLLAPDLIQVLPVATGSGMVRMAHGLYPVPAPATAAILAGSNLLVKTGGGDGEFCTPTGAALLAGFCMESVRTAATGRIIRIGYGAGDRDDPQIPNVLRLILLDSGEGLSGDQVDILETNVDDVSGELIGYLLNRVIEEGARDACSIPLLMKKGRPGQLVRVISLPEDSERLAGIMARVLGTLGIRSIPSVHRFIAERHIEEISISIAGHSGIIPVKYGLMDGECYTLKAEYESARMFAEGNNLQVSRVIREVEEAAWERVHQKQGYRQ
ncbi:MAG TPA: nickel pincer cofactor biosynthesis protein LarC [Methanospirillum sp.]|nr:nickel pincer cofactor biosynthesis protein LarC [Methanospirillum sp.]